VVVFSQFKQPLIELERRIKAAGISVVRYDGSTSRELADQIQVDFDRKYQTPDKPYKWDVVLANYKKGGVGLNLNAATQMIILDEEWNPGKVDQAYGRIDRLGQSEETTVHLLRTKKTVDMWMSSLIQQKADMIAGFETHTDLQQQLTDIIYGIRDDK
jgi:SNF2 family DNA or RNA helicase